MNKTEGKEILRKLKEQGFLNDENTENNISKKIETHLDEQINEYKKENKELIDKIVSFDSLRLPSYRFSSALG